MIKDLKNRKFFIVLFLNKFISEVYHLKAIELVCKYIPSPCPYVNHLITSYHKHYN